MMKQPLIKSLVILFSILNSCYVLGYDHYHQITILNNTPLPLTRIDQGKCQMHWDFPKTISAATKEQASKTKIHFSYIDKLGMEPSLDYGEVTYKIGNGPDKLHIKASTKTSYSFLFVYTCSYPFDAEVIDSTHEFIFGGDIHTELKDNDHTDIVLMADESV